MSVVFSYGGGRQTVAICVLIKLGVLPKPDVVVMADTSRENPSTWEYLEKHTRPMLAEMGLEIHIAGHDLATVDIYSGNGDLLLPVYTKDGKLPGFCSNEWKKRVVDRYLKKNLGISSGTKWLGYGLEERRRWMKQHNTVEGKWKTVCPLVDLMIDTHTCLEIIKKNGLPEPHHSACWMCPHKSNAEWKLIRDSYPDKWQDAVELDKEVRENDDRGGVYLHRSGVPLDEANLDEAESPEIVRQCTLGMCFV
jgi:hypothetical protein